MKPLHRSKMSRFCRTFATLTLGLGLSSTATTQGWAQEAPPAEPAAPAEDAAEETVVFETPEAVFDVAQAAFNEGDWKRFLACVAPDRRDEFIGEMAYTFASFARRADADPRVKKLVAEHLPKDFDPMDIMGSEDPRAEVIQLAKQMGDAEGFFAGAMTLANDLRFGDAEDAASITDVSEFTYSEDQKTAQATVTITTPEGDVTEPWSFKQHEAGWYLSMQ